LPIGPKALDPDAEHVVYEFSVNGRVYYTGIARADSIRATDRWNWVASQLKRLKKEGSLPPRKAKSLLTPSVAVAKALVERGVGPHTVSYSWRGAGRNEALKQEARRIVELLDQGCVLANVEGNHRRPTAQEVLAYLGYP
jgi:hypothetical protein